MRGKRRKKQQKPSAQATSRKPALQVPEKATIGVCKPRRTARETSDSAGRFHSVFPRTALPGTPRYQWYPPVLSDIPLFKGDFRANGIRPYGIPFQEPRVDVGIDPYGVSLSVALNTEKAARKSSGAAFVLAVFVLWVMPAGSARSASAHKRQCSVPRSPGSDTRYRSCRRADRGMLLPGRWCRPACRASTTCKCRR